jgi:ferric-dicitrate binding protein FerR (iron transport regulator)
MSDRHEPTPSAAHEVDPVARLVQLAGARPPVPPERAARVQARVRESWRAGVASRRRVRWVSWGASLAAAAALAVALGVGWRYASTPPAPPVLVATMERVSGSVTTLGPAGEVLPLAAGSRVWSVAPVTTGEDGRAALRLPGGPSLRLDVSTRVRFVSSDVLSLESGAVYVDSNPGPTAGTVVHPVRVETPWGRVVERGTQFEVRVGSGGVRIRVREGAVELAGSSGSNSVGRSWQAAAGAELTLATSGQLSRATVPLHGDAWGWVQQIAPSFRLEGRTLGDFLAWVGRETGWRIAFADPSRAAAAVATVLHGSIDGLSPEQALSAVLPTCGLADRRDGETVVVFASSR